MAGHPSGTSSSTFTCGARGRRRKTFAAALEQAEQLAKAADVASYATKPILLFYALSQGYRAICAARLEADWERSGHGLTVPHRGASLVEAAVVAAPSKADLYHGAIEAVGEKPLQGEVSLREAWASISELSDADVPDGIGVRPITAHLPFWEDDLKDPTAAAPAQSLFLLIEGDIGTASPEELMRSLGGYPTLSGARPASYPTGIKQGPLDGERTQDGVTWRRHVTTASEYPVIEIPAADLSVRDYLARYEAVAPFGYNTFRYGRVVPPGVGDPLQTVGPLTSWWCLLLVLSSLARYRPADWAAAIDVDRAHEAVALERTLDHAQAVIPHYIVSPLTSELRP